MSYHRNFNNTLAIWAAFGGRGELILPIPTLSWQKKYYNDFGHTQYGSEKQIKVHDNGNAQIAVYYAKTPYMSYFNKSTGEWTVVDLPWWSYGQPEILYAGGGVFLAKIVGLANIIASFDGITWHNAGYCQGAQNSMTTGAYDSSIGSGIVSWWYYKSPVYYSFDSLTERTAWTLVGAEYRYVSGIFHVNLCLMNDSATELTETNLSHVGDLANNNIPNPENIVWMEDWGKYALFNESMLYVSADGLTWEGVEQPGFTTTNSDTFGGAIYVPA
ncbi:hypothetical protein [Bacillus sp. FJAT-29937]|uniref:hypothetical protein n=1 Tax=Bacillus sp. FJAT-29937 TaxID=1720553 RepID=UPI000837A636|nr:hypothetical protein [Bacillus sp. FJAT-29937]